MVYNKKDMKDLPDHLKNKNATFRPNQVGLRKILGDLEAEAMDIVWDFGKPVIIRQVYEVMRERGKILSYLTLMTVMNRLEEKGILVIVDNVQRANVFLPALNREDFLESATGLILESLLQDFPDAVALHFKKMSDSPGVSAKLEQLIQEAAAKREEEKQ
jgi:predicted transcriptional regulator